MSEQPIATAYVQIMPSMKGVGGTLEKEFGGEADKAGEKAGSSIVKKLKKILVAAGIGTAITKGIKASLDAGGALQQSFGGLDTIYEGASEAAKKYAADAVKAGISMNDYAEQAVSFGASLKQAFKGDVTQAAEAANTAILDMADNAAKMGTPLESIQNAYQGFAKQNYTMLDNLKLGYGGTKNEMLRLLDDANAINKANGKNTEYSIENLGDIYDAIHVVQENLNLTGVAAAEAEGTFTGSMASMKAATENFLANLALGGDIETPLKDMISGAAAFLTKNLFPMLGKILKGIPVAVKALIPDLTATVQAAFPGMIDNIIAFVTSDAPHRMIRGGQAMISGVLDGITSRIPYVLANIGVVGDKIITKFYEYAPQLFSNGVAIVQRVVNGIISNLPAIITTVGTLVTRFIGGFMQNLPEFLRIGYRGVRSIVQGILKNLPAIIQASANIISRFVQTVLRNLPAVLKAGITIIEKIILGILRAIPKLPSAVGKIINTVKASFVHVDWGKLGRDIITGIVKGLTSNLGKIKEAAKSAAKKALDAAKEKLKIGSPSKVFANEVGKWIPAGIAVGIEANAKPLTASLASLSETAVGAYDLAPYSTYDGVGTDYIGAQNEGLLNLTLMLDGSTIAKNTIEYINGQTIRYNVSPLMV